MSQTTSVSCHSLILIPLCGHIIRCLVYQMQMNNLQKEDHPCVGHGVRQSQDSTSHDGVAQVED